MPIICEKTQECVLIPIGGLRKFADDFSKSSSHFKRSVINGCGHTSCIVDSRNWKYSWTKKVPSPGRSYSFMNRSISGKDIWSVSKVKQIMVFFSCISFFWSRNAPRHDERTLDMNHLLFTNAKATRCPSPSKSGYTLAICLAISFSLCSYLGFSGATNRGCITLVIK